MKSNFISLHPYFKIHPGKLDAMKAMFARFVEKTLEVHGPAAELEKLKKPLAHLNPSWFTLEAA
jgi:hypothetical protein